MRCRCFLIGLCLLLLSPFVASAAEGQRGLDIYFVDTEGGAATLVVTPAGESVLIDCGNPGARDAERIARAARAAGIKRIDHLIITHWHLDHYGGVGHLAQLLPIRRFYDRGIPRSLPEDPQNFPLLIQAYQQASQGQSTTLHPGATVPLVQPAPGRPLRLLCLCASGRVLRDEPGARPNPIAREHQPQADDPSDNAKSLGFLLCYGGFRFLDLGDLTWNVEYKLVSPTNKIGLVDVYQSTHHGLPISNNPVVIKSVRPRVAVFNNGPRKGGDPSVIGTLRRLPDIQAIYQMHRNVTVGSQENTDPEFIANADEHCQGEAIHLSVAADGKSYVVLVGHQGKPRRYQTRRQGE